MARVLVIGDTHFPAVHKNYFSFIKRVRDKYKCTEIIHIGDSKEFDYDSPKKIGIKSFYLDRKKNVDNEDIINSPSDIERLINQ